MGGVGGDVAPRMVGKKKGARKAPEPFFFRANSNGCIEYWQTNLVPNYYELDNFQVRTPTDILGQHIHLVKFDVLASDGATNGFNYEDGTLAPEEVQERVNAINANGGLQTTGGPQILPLVAPVFFCDKVNGALADHPELFDKYCNTDKTKGPIGLWVGAQTTIQRWWADPLLNNPVAGKQTDRTLRTVFTHDHFVPSTHQQAGLYAGLLVEPNGSTWTMPDPNDPNNTITMGERGKSLPGPADGGPTSWQANILAGADSFREFALELEDEQIGFLATSKATPGGSPGGCSTPQECNLINFGWFDNQKKVVNPPLL